MQERVLMVVSDDTHFVHFAEDILPDYGFCIEALSKRDLGPAMPIAQRPQVVFLDGGLVSGPDELVLVEHLRTHPVTQRTPVVVSSGNRALLDEKRKELLEKGCVVLVKPFNLSELLEAIEQASLQARTSLNMS